MYKLSIILSLLALQPQIIVSACTKKAIVIGASSGMGKEVAKRLSHLGYEVGLAARRVNLLNQLQQELPTQSYIQRIDVTDPQARDHLEQLIHLMHDVDLIVISISAYYDNNHVYPTDDTWLKKKRCIDVDAKGFIAMADCALEYFKQRGYGHLVGVSSTSGLRGVAYSPVYSGAKACVSYYMEAERNYAKQNNIAIDITDVVPGYVAVEHSPLGEDPAAYWEIPVEQAGEVIINGILAKKEIVYVPSKVRLIAFLLKYLPDYIYNNFLPWI